MSRNSFLPGALARFMTTRQGLVGLIATPSVSIERPVDMRMSNGLLALEMDRLALNRVGGRTDRGISGGHVVAKRVDSVIETVARAPSTLFAKQALDSL